MAEIRTHGPLCIGPGEGEGHFVRNAGRSHVTSWGAVLKGALSMFKRAAVAVVAFGFVYLHALPPVAACVPDCVWVYNDNTNPPTYIEVCRPVVP